MELVVDWVAILIAVAALAWTIKESVSTRRALASQEQRAKEQAERLEYRGVLDSFLLPLKASLDRSKVAFKALATGPLQRLEYYPQELRKYFESLSDARQIFWRVEINQIHDHNAYSVRLIENFDRRSQLAKEFWDACEAFSRHARKWKAMWDAINDTSIPVNKLPEGLIADPFPENFDGAVEREVERVKRAAGMQ